jgi:hypothetical protein
MAWYDAVPVLKTFIMFPNELSSSRRRKVIRLNSITLLC